MVNIIYDVNPSNDPCQGHSNNWLPNALEGVHENIPQLYLLNLLDANNTNNNLQGSMSRLYYESSFGSLVLLGDYICVDIKESTIAANNGSGDYNFRVSVNNIINANGGLDCVFGYNSIADYDSDENFEIDIVQYICRNPYETLVGFHGGGGLAGPVFTYDLLVNGTMTNHTSRYMCQGGSGCGGSDLHNPTGIIIHEFAHLLFGNNTFHTSGGNHRSHGRTNTIFGFEGGYGLMGGYNSGLVSCNGYERWRMHWQDLSNQNNNDWWIVARDANNINNIKNGDINKNDGTQSFILRDFITYGDVVRIQLPYKDNPNASNQYIWLENHQIGLNNKLDYLQYSVHKDATPWNTCRDLGAAGIYAYIQVGKDILEGTEFEVYPDNETDNLRIISAEGNWDFEYQTNEYINCVGSGYLRTEKMKYPNPLSGYQDQTYHFFDPTDNLNELSLSQGDYLWKKYYVNNIYFDGLSQLGDNLDAFLRKFHYT